MGSINSYIKLKGVTDIIFNFWLLSLLAFNHIDKLVVYSDQLEACYLCFFLPSSSCRDRLIPRGWVKRMRKLQKRNVRRWKPVVHQWNHWERQDPEFILLQKAPLMFRDENQGISKNPWKRSNAATVYLQVGNR